MRILLTLVCLVGCLWSAQAQAQSFGVELHATATPRAGAMGGASIARALDPTTPLIGNPASLSQLHGTQVTFSSTWIEPTFNVQHQGGALPNVGQFGGKSEAQGSMVGNIALSQDLSAAGLPVTLGMGLLTIAGAGVDYSSLPNSNGFSSTAQALETALGASLDLTDRLSIGGAVWIGASNFDGPFVGNSRMVYDYALRGSFGLDFELNPCTHIGAYYQSRQHFRYDNAIALELPGGNFTLFQDVLLDLPTNIGVGISNESLMDGRLLLAVDVLWKQWDKADLFAPIYDNQWVLQVGSQYDMGRIKLRAGYVYADNPIAANPGGSAGGISPPGVQDAIQLLQSGFGITGRHRASLGVGVQDVLPGVDIDIMGGGMFRTSQQYGDLTSSNIESYWVGAGFTWRFGRGAIEHGEWTSM